MTITGVREKSITETGIEAFAELMHAGDAYRMAVAGYFGAGWSEIQAVTHLVRSPDLSQTELASRLGLTSGASTALVDRLERAGLAQRQPHPGDRRRVHIQISDRGMAMVKVTRDWLAHMFDGVAEDRIDGLADDLRALARSLDHQTAHVAERLREADAG